MKAVLITGTSSGLGQALFGRLSRQVCLISLSRRFTLEQIDAARADPDSYRLIDVDLAQPDSVRAALESLDRFAWNTVTELIFINNAGVVEPQDLIGSLDGEAMALSVQANFLTPATITNYLERKRAAARFRLKIVNVTSRAAAIPNVGWAMYCATKAGMLAFVANYRTQTKNEPGVEAFDFDPGLIDSPMQERIRGTEPGRLPDVQRFVQYQQDGRLQAPDDVAPRLIGEYCGLCA